MKIIDWLNRAFGKDITHAECIKMAELAAELSYRKLAFQSAAGLAANALAKCTFRTYRNRAEMKGEEFYLWNYEPNINQNSYQFIHKAVFQLFFRNECLIVADDSGKLHVADDWQENSNTLYGNSFSGVAVDDYIFQRTFQMKDVLFLRLNFADSKPVIDAVCDSYGQMIAYAQKKYKQSRGVRGLFKVDVQAMNNDTFKQRFEKLKEGEIKKFLESDNAALPLFDGMNWEELGGKTYSHATTRDIKAMADDIFDFTARAFHIPPPLLKGDMVNTENSVDNFLTFFLRPLADLFQAEIMRKKYGKTELAKGNFMKIDTRAVKHVDLLDVATSVDRLIRSGCWNINDIRDLVGDEPIDEDFAKKHYITKNYENVEGGEKDE